MSMTVASESEDTPRQHTKPCHDCPWRRKAIPGWLGSMTITEWLAAAHSDTLIDCHALKSTRSNKQWQCAGSSIFRANICKISRSSEVLRLSQDTKIVFAWNNEFEAHHTHRKLGEKQDA